MAFLQLLLLFGSSNFEDTDAQVALRNSFLSSLIDYLHIHEITFLRSDVGNVFDDYKRVDRSLAKNGRFLYFSVLSYSDFVRDAERGFESSRNPLVIIDSEKPTFNKSDLIKVTRSVNISPFKWVLFAKSYDFNDYLEMKIPFNCQFIIAEGVESTGFNLTEVYDTTSISKLSVHLGEWTPKTGFIASTKAFFNRRGDLRGTVFNVSSTSSDPCEAYDFGSVAISMVRCIHFRVLLMMAHQWNFRIHWVVPDKINPGGLDALLPGVEFSQIEVSFVKLDKEGMSFIWPSFRTDLQIYTSHTGLALGWSTFVSPFSKNMWLTLCGWFVLSAAACGAVEFLFVRFTTRVENISYKEMWTRYFFVSFFAFCSQGYHEHPHSQSQRILFYLVFLIPTVLLPGYSAALTSILAVKVPKMPFTDLEGLVKSKDYKLGYQSSYNLSFHIDRNSSEIARALFADTLIPSDELPDTERQGLTRMCNEKFSWLCTSYTVKAVAPTCPFYKLDKPIVCLFVTIPIATDSPYKSLLDRSMRALHFTGVLLAETMRAMPVVLTAPSGDDPKNEEATTEPIFCEDIISLFAILGFGYLASLSILFAEVFAFRCANFMKS